MTCNCKSDYYNLCPHEQRQYDAIVTEKLKETLNSYELSKIGKVNPFDLNRGGLVESPVKTLRDEFSMSAPQYPLYLPLENTTECARLQAEWRYMFADAMMKAREVKS